MRRASSLGLLLAAIGLSGVALAQAPTTSNLAPAGYLPPASLPEGGGCPCTSGIPEGEANCGLPVDTENGGCNSVPPVFTPIQGGQTYCGTAGVDGDIATRDTDWYALALPNGGDVTWTVEAGFAAVIGIVDNGGVNDCSGVSSFLVFDTTTGCGDTGVVNATLPPGTWWFFVAPGFFGPDLACGSEYTATLDAPQAALAIPALSGWGLAATALALALVGFTVLARRRRHA